MSDKIPNLCKIVEISNQTPFHCFWMKMELFGHAEKFLISIMPLWCASHARLKVFLQSEQLQQESVTRWEQGGVWGRGLNRLRAMGSLRDSREINCRTPKYQY